jgi:hypothetical protein
MRRPLLVAVPEAGAEQRGVSHDPLPRYDDPGKDGHAVLPPRRVLGAGCGSCRPVGNGSPASRH